MQLAIWEQVIRVRGKLRSTAALVALVCACMQSTEPASAQNDTFFPTFAGTNQPATQPQPASPGPASAVTLGGFPSEAGPVSVSGAASYYSGYRLTAQDLLSISIWEAPEFSRAVRIAPDGTIRLPLLPNPVQMGGLTVLEAEQHIAESLVDGGLLVDPIVAVTVTEFNGNPVRVSGAVRRPVIVQAIGPTTLLSAITQAGGIDTAWAGPEIVIERPGAESVRFPTGEFIGGVNGVENYSLTGGETVRARLPALMVLFRVLVIAMLRSKKCDFV
jgi:polysaccharide export outer membrane protein